MVVSHYSIPWSADIEFLFDSVDCGFLGALSIDCGFLMVFFLYPLIVDFEIEFLILWIVDLVILCPYVLKIFGVGKLLPNPVILVHIEMHFF